MPTIDPQPETTWQATLLPASFRGVPFAVEDESGSVGRRGRLHEYPFRDTPWAEDLGRRARRYRIVGFVIGDDAAQQRDALIEACEQKGPGTLVHPTLGFRNVQVDPDAPIEWLLRKDEGRVIALRLAFVEAGEVIYPTADADTQALTGSRAADATAAARADFVGANGEASADLG